VVSGLDSNDVKDAVAKETDRIGKSMEESMQASLTSVRKQLKECAKLLKGLDVAKETELRKAMVGLANKLATAVSKLKKVSDQVIVAYTNQQLSFAEEHRELSGETAETDAMCVYYITVYAALTLFRDPQTWAMRGANGEKTRANLRQAVTTLNSAPVLAVEIKFNHQVVKEMRDELKLRRPEATVSDQAVATGSEATIVAHPVSTSSEATVSVEPVSTSSGTTVSGQPVSTSSEATVSGQSVSAGSAPTGFAPVVLVEDSAQPAQNEDSPASAPTLATDKTPAHVKKRPARAKGKEKAAAKPKQNKRSRVPMQADVEEKTATPARRSQRISDRSEAIDQAPGTPPRDGWGNGEVSDTMRDADEIFHAEDQDEDELEDESKDEGDDGQADWGA